MTGEEYFEFLGYKEMRSDKWIDFTLYQGTKVINKITFWLEDKTLYVDGSVSIEDFKAIKKMYKDLGWDE